MSEEDRIDWLGINRWEWESPAFTFPVDQETQNLLMGLPLDAPRPVEIASTTTDGNKTTFILYKVKFEPIRYKPPTFKWWQWKKKRDYRKSVRNALTVSYTGKVVADE